MNKFIDNTYLHDVYRCLCNEACDMEQVKSFLRFVGEIIATDRLFYAVGKSGPVFPITEKIVNAINGYSGSEYVSYIPLEKELFEDICHYATTCIQRELDRLDFKLYENAISNINPVFAGTNPHKEIIDLILDNNQTGQVEKNHSEPISSNIVPYVITQPSIIGKIKSCVADSAVSVEFITFVSILIRMFACDKMASSNDLIYVPATSRLDKGYLNPSVNEHNILRVESNTVRAIDRPDELSDIPDIVDCLLIECNGEPKNLLESAFDFRKKTESIRIAISDINNSDALLIRNLIVRELQIYINAITGNNQNSPTGLIVQENKMLIGIPENITKTTPMLKSITTDNIKSIANMFLNANEKRRYIICDRFLLNCLRFSDYSRVMTRGANERNDRRGIAMNKAEKINLKILGNANTININSVANTDSLSFNDADAVILVGEINRLIKELENYEVRYNSEIALLTAARDKIEAGKKNEALSNIKKLGKETWDIAKGIGIRFLAKVIGECIEM